MIRKFLLPSLLFGVLIFLCKNINADLSTSIPDMENLIEIETKLIENFENYIKANDFKLDLLKQKLEKLKDENNKAKGDTLKYVTNPISAFSLIRRLGSDWTKIETFLSDKTTQELIEDISKIKKTEKFPTIQDIQEAASGFRRLQDTYELSHMEMASGLINGVQYDSQLSSIDSFDLSIFCFVSADFYGAGKWLNVALNRFEEDTVDNIILDFNKERIIQVAVTNKKKQSDFKGAIELLDQLLDSNPKNITKVLEDKKEIENELLNLGTDNIPSIGPPEKPDSYKLYEQGCRGEYELTGKNRNLICKFETQNHKFLILAPIKVEVVNLNPYLVIFHDVVTHDEIEFLKTISKPLLSRANVVAGSDKLQKSIDGRTSKYAWFRTTFDKKFQTIEKRIDDMTGLSMEFAENFQVMNYGLGGHYSTHYDYFDTPTDAKLFNYLEFHKGNRIATVLFYMSDVEQGGSTVFPNLKLAVRPKKGTAVFWYNMDSRGYVDPRTLHAACPVLVGSKWVFNKWIRAGDQIFRRPCELI